MTNTHPYILVFDSGLGGTTVLEAIQQRLPNAVYSYLMDNAGFPYSNKTDDFLLERMLVLFDKVIPLLKPDLVVIACNTASTLALSQLREKHHLPFVGVVPAIKPAALLSKSHVLALLATEATIQRDYVDQLRTAHASNCELLRLGSQQLVELSEQKLLGNPLDNELIKEALKPLEALPGHENIDVFILGCTHFPAIKEEIARAWQFPALWIDSGDAIARRVEDLCTGLPGSTAPSTATLLLTGNDPSGKKQTVMERFGIHRCQLLEID